MMQLTNIRCLILLSVLVAVNAAVGQETHVLFERDVRPIFKAHCFHCHGEEPELGGGLDLRLVRLARSGGDSGPAIDSATSENSLLWQKIASDEMPANDKKLSADQKATVLKWIQGGARTARPEPNDLPPQPFTEEELSFWAFQPVHRVTPPPNDAAAALSPVDRFLLAKLQELDRGFSPSADKSSLLRRLSFDLRGIPPSVDELREFLDDSSPLAWGHWVDRFLASPQYGVRWGRHWLDVAGYAESNGNQGQDPPRPHAWRYRDYVVRSLNSDKPYDQFLLEQLAGDEVQPELAESDRIEALTATGFLRMAPDVTETEDTLADRNQAVAEVIKVVGSGVLGLTIGCAQCHDHRYDPISIEDYYRFRAIFDPAMPLTTWRKPSQRLADHTDAATRAAIATIEADATARDQDIQRRKREHAQTIQDRELDAAPAEVRGLLRDAVNTPADQQTAAQRELLDLHPTVRTLDWIVGQLIEYDMPAYRKFEAEEREVAQIRQTKPLEHLLMTVSVDPQSETTSAVFFRGDPAQPQQSVDPSELFALTRDRLPRDGEQDSRVAAGRRLNYVRQLTDGSHPLVARVLVNRVWLHHFGRGLVATPGDFGQFGERPTHPELLDYLAAEFMRHGWSIKWLHRELLNTHAYRQSSRRTAELEASDPENRWYGRMSLRRLSAEEVRDALLAATDQLDLSLGGPSVPVSEDPEGRTVIGTRAVRDGLLTGVVPNGRQASRRSLYIAASRNLPLTVLDTFDLPTMSPNCHLREATTSSAQSLWFLNDEMSIACSERLAEQARSQAGETEARIDYVYRTLFGHGPTEDERAWCVAFLAEQQQLAADDPDETWQKRLAEDPAAAALRALSALCQMLLASNRFLYVP